MNQDGVEVRPIVQLTGGAEFNEVFFTNARTDADLVVGEIGGGWQIAMGLLGFERGVSTLGQQVGFEHELADLTELAKANGSFDSLERRFHRAKVELDVMRANVVRGSHVSIAKLVWANWHRNLGELAMDVLGADGLTHGDELNRWQNLYLFSRADTIYGGSDEIQRNILAERVLGLPREPKGV
jgi:alkylation response protein AidB-like acyl-CoA dehydrogenase